MVIDTLVEGLLDEAVARRLLAHCGHTPGVGYGKRGVDYLRNKVTGFNVRAAYGNPILALVDFMDTRIACPPAVATTWLPDCSPRLLLRIVVPEIESWLLADRNGMAALLRITPTLLPTMPELLPDPKRALVNLARRSQRKSVRVALAPSAGVSAVVGPEYGPTLVHFVQTHWNVDAARQVAPSLDRCLRRLSALSESEFPKK